MIGLGLLAAERRALASVLQTGYKARTRVVVLDQDEREVVDLPAHVLSGSVNVTAKQRPSRTLELELLDEGQRFRFAPEGIGDSHLYADNFLRVFRGVWVPDLEDWVDIPVFTGPVASLDRDGHTISVQAVGKEVRGLEPAVSWNPAGPFGRDRKVTDVIRAIMRAQGERRFDLPRMNATLRKQISLGRHSEPWRVCQRLAEDVDRHLFYDGRGVLRLRPWPRKPVWTFRTGDEANVTTPPHRTYELDEMRNTIEVLGAEPEGKEERPRAVAIARRGHPLSPWSLARHDEPLFLVETIEVGAKRVRVLEGVAERELEDRLRAAVQTEFEALPVPQLEPDDLVALVTDGERTTFRLREFTIPLTGEAMTIGFRRRPRKRGRR